MSAIEHIAQPTVCNGSQIEGKSNTTFPKDWFTLLGRSRAKGFLSQVVHQPRQLDRRAS